MICYADGSNFEGEANDAPRKGVLGIIQKGTTNPHLMNKDYYYFFMGEWWGTDNPCVALEKHRTGCPLLHGEFTTKPEWDRFLGWFLHA